MRKSELVFALALCAAACATPGQPKSKTAPAGRGPQSAPAVQPAPARNAACALQRRLLDRELRRFRETCGERVAVSFDWAKCEKQRKQAPIETHGCRRVLYDLHRFCRWSGVRAVARFSTIRCEIGGGPAISLRDEGVLVVRATARGNIPYRTKTREALLRLPLDKKTTYAEELGRVATQLCIDGEHAVLVAPHFAKYGGVSTGKVSGSAFIHLPGSSSRANEPRGKRYRFSRMFVDRRVPRVRGFPLVEIDLHERTCRLRCKGYKTLKLADYAATQRLLASATYRSQPDVRRPHALARDKRGVYYYVDRSSLKDAPPQYRVYIGKRGKLRQQKMVDVVDDSEGQILATRRGKLRLWVGKADALWIRSRRRKKLTRLPLAKNTTLIYEQLGVYWGKKHHTPCDHF